MTAMLVCGVIIFASVLADHQAASSSFHKNNKFGIGCYYPPGEVGQLQATADLVGAHGWTTILIPCGVDIPWNTSTVLPPACPGYSAAQALETAYALNLSVVARLEPQYTVNAVGDTACFGRQRFVNGKLWQGHLRELSDDSSHTTYAATAQGFVRVAQSLPLPPDGSDLFVQIGNELNLAWSCGCSDNEQCLTMDVVAAEAAYFLRDCLSALKKLPRVRVAISPIAPIGRAGAQCCVNSTCAGFDDITMTVFEFEEKMLKAVPTLWNNVDWLSTHSYPCSQPGCGLSDGTHAPAQPCTGWNAAFDLAKDWLTGYRNESRLISPHRQIPVIITETGWCSDCCTEQQRADWTVQAFKELWLEDDQVIGVTPFLLAGRQWEAKGFVWKLSNGTKLPVFDAVKQFRLNQSSNVDPT